MHDSSMSQQYRSSQQQQSKVKKKQDDPDEFMRLTDTEIAGCITDIGVNFSPADLQRPNPQQIQVVFEHLGELLMNATRDSIDPAMRAAAEDVCADFPDVVPIDTRLLMGFFTSLRSMLVECGVHDFSFGDLVRPTHERLVKIFSYIINFVRFRESQTSTIDANFNKAESTKNRIETLYMENQDMEQRLEDMRRNRKAMEAAVKEKQKRNDEIKARLIELRKGQDRLQDHLQRAKASKESSGTMLEDKTERLMRTRQECEKLKPYVTQSPAALQGSLTELSDNLAKVRGQNDALERRSRALQTSTDSFAVVHTDVASCIKILDEIQVELQKEDEEDLKASKNKDSLSDYRRSVEDKERDEQVLMKTLRRWEERTDELKQKHRDRDIANKKKMEELRSLQKEIKEERAEKGRDMERKKIRVEQTEKKMADLKDAIEQEVNTTREEYFKLESHIKLYLNEMEQSI